MEANTRAQARLRIILDQQNERTRKYLAQYEACLVEEKQCGVGESEQKYAERFRVLAAGWIDLMIASSMEAERLDRWLRGWRQYCCWLVW